MPLVARLGSTFLRRCRGTINQLSPLVVSGEVRVASTTADFRVPSLTSCNTIDTDSNGVLLCGTDATGGGGGSGSIDTSTNPTMDHLAWWDSVSTLASVATGTLSANAPLSLTGTTVNSAFRLGSNLVKRY